MYFKIVLRFACLDASFGIWKLVLKTFLRWVVLVFLGALNELPEHRDLTVRLQVWAKSLLFLGAFISFKWQEWNLQEVLLGAQELLQQWWAPSRLKQLQQFHYKCKDMFGSTDLKY